MKKRRLPNADLANICTMKPSDQRGVLLKKKAFRPPHSLEATRRNMPAIIGAVGSLPLMDVERDKEKSLKNFLSGLNDRDREPNRLRFEALWGFSERSVSLCANQEYGSHRISVESSVKFTDPLVLEIDGGRFIPTSDLRKSGRLVRRAQDFVFALNYHLLIDQDPDFETYGLVLLDYWHDTNSNFGITPHFFDGTPRYSYEDLSNMIAYTYSLWDEILDERRRRDGGSEDEGLFGAA